jgi:hypothetical protein
MRRNHGTFSGAFDSFDQAVLTVETGLRGVLAVDGAPRESWGGLPFVARAKGERRKVVQTGASWNRRVGWLRQLEGVRKTEMFRL